MDQLIGSVAAAFDRAATAAAYAPLRRARRRNRSEGLSHDERLEALASMAASQEAIDQPFFREPRRLEISSWQRLEGTAQGPQVVDIRWRSDASTHLPELVERYHRGAENRQAAARLFLHETPQPMMILIHGYLAGRHFVEQRLWPTAWLRRMGLDLALFVLPYHGVRAMRERVGPPPFPSSDPRITNEGFRQAIGDLRDLIAWVRERGHPEVGLMGMSLGGYTTSLAATVERDLSFVIPVIPLGSLADWARDQGRLGRTGDEEEAQHAALDRVHHVVSPLHRAPNIDGDRTLVIAAAADRITPVRHAERLADHFGAPLQTWPGGHLLQLGRSRQFRQVGRFLNRLGVVKR